MNVSGSPPQVGFDPDVKATKTEGVLALFVVIIIAVEVAVVGLAQLKLEVITQVTDCPFVSEEVINVALFVPILEPSTFH